MFVVYVAVCRAVKMVHAIPLQAIVYSMSIGVETVGVPGARAPPHNFGHWLDIGYCMSSFIEVGCIKYSTAYSSDWRCSQMGSLSTKFSKFSCMGSVPQPRST